MPLDDADRDEQRLVLAALFMAAHIVAGDVDVATIDEVIAAADKLLDRVTKTRWRR